MESRRRFKRQMIIGIVVGLVAIGLLVAIEVNGKRMLEKVELLGAAVLGLGILSAMIDRTAGFFVGLVLAAGVAALIAGCGIAVVCGSILAGPWKVN